MVKLIMATIGFLLLLCPCENVEQKLQKNKLNQEAADREELISAEPDSLDFETNELFGVQYIYDGPFPLEVIHRQDNLLYINPGDIISTEVNQEKHTILTLLEQPPAAERYVYKCSAGNESEIEEKDIEYMACFSSIPLHWTAWFSHHVKVRCGATGSGLIISYVGIIFTAMLPNVECSVIEGGIGSDFIGIAIKILSSELSIYIVEAFTD